MCVVTNGMIAKVFSVQRAGKSDISVSIFQKNGRKVLEFYNRKEVQNLFAINH